MKRALARLTRIRQPPENLFVDLMKILYRYLPTHFTIFSSEFNSQQKSNYLTGFLPIRSQKIVKIVEEKEFLIKKLVFFCILNVW